MFEVTFLREPSLSVGKHIEKLDDPRIWRLPTSDAGIWRWEKNRDGYYIGAYPYFTIDVVAIEPAKVPEGYINAPKIIHHPEVRGSGHEGPAVLRDTRRGRGADDRAGRARDAGLTPFIR